MNKEEFLKELNNNLSYLKKDIRESELKKYENLPSYDLDSILEANKIYKEHNINYRITSNIKFIDAFKTVLSTFKDKEKRTNTILFFLKILLIIIIIKIPFIYIRDMIATMFNNLFINDRNYFIWYLIIEISYALVGIYIIIKQTKKEAYKLKNES